MQGFSLRTKPIKGASLACWLIVLLLALKAGPIFCQQTSPMRLEASSAASSTWPSMPFLLDRLALHANVLTTSPIPAPTPAPTAEPSPFPSLTPVHAPSPGMYVAMQNTHSHSSSILCLNAEVTHALRYTHTSIHT